MRQIFEASYKSFYFLMIPFLWITAITLALLQSGIVVEFALKNLLPKYGVYIESANGGILSGIEFKGIRYDTLLSASELRCRLEITPLLNGEISLSYLDIKNLRVNEEELEKLIRSDSKTPKPEFLNIIKIENLSLTLPELQRKDIKFSNLKLNSDYIYYNFDNFYMDLKAEADSNIASAKFHGDILDANYSLRGSVKPNGSSYINKLVNDPDFEFNALKESDFVLKGDGDSLYAKALIKNSGVIYKSIVDAKINNVISQLRLNLNDLSFIVDTNGEVESKYAVANSEFSVVYDGEKTSYFGKGKISKFKHIPLGVFTQSLKIKNVDNLGVEFSGDFDKVEAKTKNRVIATLLDRRFDIESSESLIKYDFAKKLLDVSTKAGLHTDFLYADVESRVVSSDKLFYSGSASNFTNLSLGVDKAAFEGMRVAYSGSDQTIDAEIKALGGVVKINSNDYDTYNFDALLKDIKPLNISGSPTITAQLKGDYNHKKDGIAADIKLFDTKIFGKSVISDKISFKKTPDSLFIADSKIKIGGVSANIKAATTKGVLDATLQTKGAKLSANGVLNKELKLLFLGDGQVMAEEYSKITGSPKQNISGDIRAEATLFGEAKNMEFSAFAFSKAFRVGEENLKDIYIKGEHKNGVATLHALNATYQDKPYRLTKPSIIKISKDEEISGNFTINDMLIASFLYHNGILNSKANIKNFSYQDGNKLFFLLDAQLNGVYKDKKLTVSGDAYLKDLKVGFEPKSSTITRDKDIIILKPKRVQFDEQNFIDNVALQIDIINANAAVYSSKEAYAPIDLNLLYYKDFGQKPVLLGLIKTANGRYDLEGKRFYLLPSEIVLTQMEPNNPYLDVTLKYVDKDREVYIYAKEFASSPKINFSSKPAMSEKEIISYLLFGIDPGSAFTKTGDDAKYSSKAIAALSSVLSRDLTKELGVKFDKIEISPTEKTDANGKVTKTTKVEVGKRVTKELTVTYKNDIESSIVFEYQINKNINVESQAGRKSSIDIYYKQDY